MSLYRVAVLAAVLIGCLPASESRARGCRLLARRIAPRCSCYRSLTQFATTSKICRTEEVISFGESCFYSAVVCDTADDTLVLADCGLPVDNVGDPCDGNPPNACEDEWLRTKKVEGVYIQDKYVNGGHPIDAKPNKTAGFETIDVKYNRGVEIKFARVYVRIRDKRTIALPISEKTAENPLAGTAEHVEGRLDVLSARLPNGPGIKSASLREKAM